ncbi:hypothetical protein AB4Y32_20040 [Paraburkholderia phymatum]|uniref:Uncharacterized protein n=1 Tax=Paraburkholderia phymatum TaxID=148447 RepID=A0ACC6U2Z7_9BURK
MSCEACDRMHCSDATVPHDELRALHKPKKLRPLGRKPVLVQNYQCRVCGTNWMREFDPQRPDHPEWVCLHHASSILDPLAALEPEGSSPSTDRQSESAVTREPIIAHDIPHHAFRPEAA